jgi:hypothetical protein
MTSRLSCFWTLTFCCLLVTSLLLALDRVHHVGLLRQHGVAEILGPIDLVAHHLEHVRR